MSFDTSNLRETPAEDEYHYWRFDLNGRVFSVMDTYGEAKRLCAQAFPRGGIAVVSCS